MVYRGGTSTRRDQKQHLGTTHGRGGSFYCCCCCSKLFLLHWNASMGTELMYTGWNGRGKKGLHMQVGDPLLVLPLVIDK